MLFRLLFLPNLSVISLSVVPRCHSTQIIIGFIEQKCSGLFRRGQVKSLYKCVYLCDEWMYNSNRYAFVYGDMSLTNSQSVTALDRPLNAMRVFLSVFTHIHKKNLLLLNFLFSGMFIFPLYIAQCSMSFTPYRMLILSLSLATAMVMCFIWYIMWSLLGNMEIKLHFDRNVIYMNAYAMLCSYDQSWSLSTEEADI